MRRRASSKKEAAACNFVSSRVVTESYPEFERGDRGGLRGKRKQTDRCVVQRRFSPVLGWFSLGPIGLYVEVSSRFVTCQYCLVMLQLG